MHRNNVRRQKRKIDQSHLGETVRIASILQKGVNRGRSSYVEMHALSRLTNYNITSKVHSVKSLLKGPDGDLADLLSKIPSAMADGYTNVLTPNGIVRENELDRLLAIDSDAVTCLGIIESDLKSGRKTKDSISTLKELLEERKRLVDALRA